LKLAETALGASGAGFSKGSLAQPVKTPWQRGGARVGKKDRT
jgi:hypothetical protein